MTRTEITIQALTCAALAGLLGAVGLRLTLAEVKGALRRSRFIVILLVNFLVVPALAVAAAILFGLKRDVSVAMLLLAAAPFAPVVPVFARMARADLALAAGLTALFPVASAVLTPVVAQLGLRMLANTGSLKFNMLSSLLILLATITLPLAIGVFIRHGAPNFARRLLRPIEIISEATGATSLAFVTVTEYRSIANLGWQAWLAMALISTVSLWLGWLIGGPRRDTRQVVALGTSNRNIALAVLVAIQSFPGTEVTPAVVGNGLLLIGFGLLYVGWWRWNKSQQTVT